MSPSPTFSSTSTGFSVRKRKPRMRFCSSSPFFEIADGLSLSQSRRQPSPARLLPFVLLALGRGAVTARCLQLLDALLHDREIGEHELEVCRSRSRQASTEPSGAARTDPRTREQRGAPVHVRSRASRSAWTRRLAAVRRGRQGWQIDVRDVGRHPRLGLKSSLLAGVDHRELDHADVNGHAAKAGLSRLGLESAC